MSVPCLQTTPNGPCQRLVSTPGAHCGVDHSPTATAGGLNSAAAPSGGPAPAAAPSLTPAGSAVESAFDRAQGDLGAALDRSARLGLTGIGELVARHDKARTEISAGETDQDYSGSLTLGDEDDVDGWAGADIDQLEMYLNALDDSNQSVWGRFATRNEAGCVVSLDVAAIQAQPLLQPGDLS